MNNESIKNLYYKCCNLKTSVFLFPKDCKMHPEWKDELKKNEVYKNKHKGERCFILGNGPSLKTEDLKLLANEYVFSVNQFARYSDFEYVKPTYHFWADRVFFDIDESKPEDQELLYVMKSVNTEENIPHCFFPIEQKSFVHRFHLDEELQINYFYSGFCFHSNYNKAIDYTGIVPGFGTVVHWCITMAVYMGFHEIYLLGCDNTGLMVTMKSAMKQNDEQDYAYFISENGKKRMETQLKRQSLEESVSAYLRTLRDYRNLFQYCKKRKVYIVNCSSTTVIDSIPRKPLSDVLKEKRQ